MAKTTLKLIRQKRDGIAVTGYIDVPFGNDIIRCATLENADFIIPAGKYPLKNTWSNRFNKLMPLVCDVPERDGIRIHMGVIPEHSKGCILVSAFALPNIQTFINNINKNLDEDETDITLEISD